MTCDTHTTFQTGTADAKCIGWDRHQSPRSKMKSWALSSALGVYRWKGKTYVVEVI